MSRITKLTPESTKNDVKETSQIEYNPMRASTVKYADVIRNGKYRISLPVVKP